MKNDIDQILHRLQIFRKKRKKAVFLFIGSLAIIGISFYLEPISIKLSVPAFIVGSIVFTFWLIALNINCRTKCPRCETTYCLKGFYYRPFARKCCNCGLNLNAIEASDL